MSVRKPIDYISLAQYAVCIPISLFALSSLSYLLYRQSKFRQRLISVPILINMVTWMVSSFFNLLYVSTAIFSWFAGGVDPTLLFWSGGTFLAATTAASVSVLFLLLDRCFILTGPSWLNTKTLHKLNAICVASDFFIVLAYFYVIEKPDVKETKCQSFSCLATNKAYILYCIRLFYGTLNTIVASIFAYLLYRYNKKRNTQVKTHIVVGNETKGSASSRSNIIAGINVISQIVFNFLPNLASFTAQQAFGVTLTSVAGPVVATLSQVDGLCSTIVYLVIIGGRVMNGKKVTSTAAPTVISRNH
ncbi:hypothetical protein M3Y95_00823900 [Aphelenchoides besseyi]|nr:hypothetical protein M3Y95_00823900 [Aphelenchoides besseyi]